MNRHNDDTPIDEALMVLLTSASNAVWIAHGEAGEAGRKERLSLAGLAIGLAERLVTGETVPSSEACQALRRALETLAPPA
ncbi:MAG TPA: hypothetical protein VGE07_13295 [Herpetosiphonaceae bacterium]